ncbi:hypothetical protein [Halosimplex sp. J119]
MTVRRSKPPAATRRGDDPSMTALPTGRRPRRPPKSTADDDSDPEDPDSPPRFP